MGALRATKDLPLTVAVYGSWGSGKSSFMMLCKEKFEFAGYRTIWFNPWKYDRRDEIWHALVQTIALEVLRLEQSSPGAQFAETREKALAVSKTFAWLLARRAAVIASAGIVSDSVLDSIETDVEGHLLDQYAAINRIESDFADLVRSCGAGYPLVVFLDDLDRCTPEAALTALDSLRLFLGESNCIFMLGIDQEALVSAATTRYGGNETLGRLYLEKLVHFPFHLPSIPFHEIYSAVNSELASLANDPSLWAIVESTCSNNPRRVRRFVNAIKFAITCLETHSTPSRERVLNAASLLGLRLNYPRLYEHVLSNESSWDRMSRVSVGDDSVDLTSVEHEMMVVYPDLREHLASTSPHRSDRDFPPVPSPSEIAILTEVLAAAASASEIVSSEQR